MHRNQTGNVPGQEGAVKGIRREAGLDKYLAEWRERENIPAAYLAVVVRGQFYGAVSGTLKRDNEAPATMENRFRIGSVTKPMTSTLVLLLASNGKLSLDAHPSRYLPELTRTMHPGYRDITLRHLLTHTAGLPRPGTGRGFGRKAGETAEQYAVRERRTNLIEEYFKDAPAQAIGEYAYSNNGYTILGTIAEAATGIPYERLMVETLFRPLEMLRSGVGLPGTKGVLSEPWYYAVKDGREQPPFEPIPANNQGACASPNGGIYTSIADSCRFMQSHLRWYGRRNDAGMRADIRREMFEEPFGPKRNLAWQTWQEGRFGIALTHSGQNSDHRGPWQCSNMRIIPGADFGIFLTTTNGIEGGKVHTAVNELQAYILGAA